MTASNDARLVVELEARVDKFEKRLSGAAANLDKFGAHAARAGNAATSFGKNTSKAAQMAARASLDMSFATRQTLTQLPDIFQGILTGQGAFRVMIQQGGQLAQIYGMSPGGVGGSLRQVRSEITAMITPTRLLAVGVVGLAAGAAASVVAWKNYATQLDDLSRMTDIARTDLSKLQAAASFDGIGQADFASGMQRFARAVYEAHDGTNDLAKLLRANRMEVGETEEAFERVADLIMRARNDQQRLAILRQSSLPAAMEWVRLMEDGAAGIRQAKGAAAEFGGIADDSMIERARRFDREWNKAWTNFGLYSRSAITHAADGIDAFMTDMTNRWLRLRPDIQMSPQSVIDWRFPPRSQWMEQQDRTGGPRSVPVTPGAEARALQLERQRIAVLGELATVQEKVALKEMELAIIRANNSRVTEADTERIIENLRATEALNAKRTTLVALGPAATDYERYGVVVDDLKMKLEAGRISQETFNRAVIAAEPTFGALQSSAMGFVNDFAIGLMRGQSLMESLDKSAMGLSQTLSSMAVGQLFQGNFVGAAAMTGGSMLASLFGGGNDQAQQQAAQQAALEAQRRAEEAQRRAEQQAEAAANYRYQAAVLGIDTGTQAGALAKLELDIQRGRAEAVKTGGAAIIAFEQLAQAQRLAHEREWADQIAEVRLSYEDRIFAALNDTSTIAGKLAEFDRNAERERTEALRTYGHVLVEIEQAHALERNKIVQGALQEQIDYYDNLKRTIGDFTRGLQFGNLSTLSPAEQYLASRNEYQQQLELARSGDRTVLGDITGGAQTLLEQARAYLGPSVEYGNLVDRVTRQLNALPDIAMAADPQVQELHRIGNSSVQTVDALATIRSELEETRKENRALQQQLARLLADGNKRLTDVQSEVNKLRTHERIGSAEAKLRRA